jgi:hypothetical protein
VHIAWTAFGQVVVVSFGVAVGLIVLFAIGVALLSGPTSAQDGSRRALPRLVPAWGCFVACALCVAYGLYLLVAA